ncbi:hypothetical protein D0Y60_10355 [Shinella sp. WSJ-2]|uniref:hypothetical protein n=1 Tax=Shinella sp. WSJ-2 TaxID=2303749 RepID=UPI000E3C7ACB|nr:hypothetical protein [Shinella sp. WSJ-2]RFZ88227.1 hypothetical protein D0Y60_10355 [Shinella sp. WSJ-2]
MPSRLTNRFEGYTRLQPEKFERHAALLELIQSLGIVGSVFYVLSEIPEQGEDLLTLLCDDQLVISFELPRQKIQLSAVDIVKVPVAEYRAKIGQGKHRIRLDETLKNARILLCG